MKQFVFENRLEYNLIVENFSDFIETDKNTKFKDTNTNKKLAICGTDIKKNVFWKITKRKINNRTCLFW